MTIKLINDKFHLLVLLIFSVAINFNTLYNEYALDDIVVMTENKFVNEGINGIPGIFTNDLMSGYSTKESVLTQPRYRPFSLAVFSIEHEIWGNNPFVSHLINVLLFTLTIALLYHLLNNYLFREKYRDLVFITCLLFAAHPIHTEVIANVKSRDEIITFFFIISALIFLLKYFNKKSPLLLIAGLICFFLALLTRESAVTFIGVFPLILYFFYNQSIKKSLRYAVPLIGVFAGYLLLRYSIIGIRTITVTDVLNSPFLYATSYEAFATKIYIVIKYLALLIFPHPLSSDYSYHQIPYLDFNTIQFIGSFLLIVSLLVYSFINFRKRSIISFVILYFFITISLVTNLLIDIGTPLSERLLFQPSLAFSMLTAIVIVQLHKRSKLLSSILVVALLTGYSIKTIARNNDWKSNETLYMSDVISAPNSVRTTLFASEIYRDKAKREGDHALKEEYLNKSVYYGERSLQIHPGYAVTYLHVGFSYFDKSDYDKAAELWMKGYSLDPSDPEAKKCTEVLSNIFYRMGNGFYEQGKSDSAIYSYLKSVELNESNVESWYNLGGCYFLINDSIHANAAWQKVFNINPHHRLNKREFLFNK